VKKKMQKLELTIQMIINQLLMPNGKIIYDKLEKIVKSGANIVLSKLPIGDLAT